jgi:hypothetical protein
MKNAVTCNNTSKKEEYSETPLEFYRLKRFYLNILERLPVSSNREYLISHCLKLLDDLNFNLKNVISSEKNIDE